MFCKSLKRSLSPCSSASTSSKRRRDTPQIPLSSPVRFLILSDTHDNELTSYPECDVLLHCGDLTEDGSPKSIEQGLAFLSKFKAGLKLVIAGNHEIVLDKDFYVSQGGCEAPHNATHSLVYGPDSKATKSQITWLEEGTHEFSLKSGAHFKVHTSQWTPQYGQSAFQYPTNEDRYNPARLTPKWAKNVATDTTIIPEGVDIVMTHGPPQYILDDTGDGRSGGCEHLRRAIARAKPRLHCFGHIHRGYGAQRIKYIKDAQDGISPLTKEFVGKNQSKRKGFAKLNPGPAEDFKQSTEQGLCINAAIIDQEGEPGNVPWLVELELPVLARK